MDVDFDDGAMSLWGRNAVATAAAGRSESAAPTAATDQSAGGSSRNSPHPMVSATASSTSLASNTQVSSPHPQNITQFNSAPLLGPAAPNFSSPFQPPPAPVPMIMQGTPNQMAPSAPPSHIHSHPLQVQEPLPHSVIAAPSQSHLSHVLPPSPSIQNPASDLHNLSDDFLRSWASAAGPLIQPLQDIEKAFRPRP